MLACQRAASFVATVLPVPLSRLARPCDLSSYTYTPSGRSPAQSAASGFGALGFGGETCRAWHLGYSSRRDRSRPLSRSTRRSSRRLRGVSRCDASSAGYGLLASRRAPPRNRRTAPPRVAQLGTRPLASAPHLPFVALCVIGISDTISLRFWARRFCGRRWSGGVSRVRQRRTRRRMRVVARSQ